MAIEQRKGESTEDYEKRKRRVNLVRMLGGGGGLAHASIPTVKSSTIVAANTSRILVEWSEDMKGTGNIKDAINIIVDGAAAVHPASVTFTGKFMALALPAPATAGQVITWAYDDQNPTERLDTVAGNVEADNQTYAVNNEVA